MKWDVWLWCLSWNLICAILLILVQYFVHYDTQNLILSYVATVSTNENTGNFQVLQDVRFTKNIYI